MVEKATRNQDFGQTTHLVNTHHKMTHPLDGCVDDKHWSMVWPTLLLVLRQFLFPGLSPSVGRRQADLRIRRYPPWTPPVKSHIKGWLHVPSFHALPVLLNHLYPLNGLLTIPSNN